MSPPIGRTAGGAVPSRSPWWMFVLAAIFLGYYALLVSSDLTRPEPIGLVLGGRDSEILVHAVAPASPSALAGVRAGDRVVEANTHPIRNRLDWLSVEMNLRTGQPLRLDVARDGGRETVTLVPRRAPASYWLTSAGVTLLCARGVQLVTLVLALLVAFRRPHDPAARVGAWLLATIAVYSIVWPYQMAATWRALPAVVGLALWIPFASSLAVAAIVFTFFATFPQPIIRLRWLWFAAWLPMAATLFLQLQFASRVVYRPDHSGAFFDWTPVSSAVMTGYTMLAVASLVIGYRRLTDPTQRRRIRVLVLGSSVGLVSAFPIIAGYWWRSEVLLGDSIFTSPTIALGSIVALALPCSFTYAILRHRLFDIRLIIRLGLQYALARRVLVSIVPAAAVIFLADLWTNRQIPFAEFLRSRGWAYAGLAALAVVARLRRDNWLDALDRRFFRERLNAQQLLRGIGEEIRTATSLDEVAVPVVTRIETALHPEFVALLLRVPGEPRCSTVAMAPVSAGEEPLSLSVDGKILDLLRLLRKPVQLPAGDRSWVLRHLPPEDVDWLARTPIELVVPVRLGGASTEVFFALGAKRSEEPYSSEDEDLLMAIANNLALLLGRAPALPAERDAFEECPTCGTCYDFGVSRCRADGAALKITALPRVLCERYRLERRVGQGGMGTVYAARDNALGRQVAAKVLREDLVAPDAAERFQSEARLAAALAHPNVVTIHDIGVTASGRAFFIMELLDGVTLGDELRRNGRLAPARVVRIVRGVASAVEAAHRRQMIHRDLKPDNVFLCGNDPGDVPKVLDFGLAKALEASDGVMTRTGIVAGTPLYMAPEHLAGDDPSPDWDLWALAVMSFEMITGALPSGGPARLTERVNDLPPGLRRLFSRALSANPIDRPTSAQEFSDELDRELSEAAPHELL